ncbi:MAG: OB-fold domain-containing protein [Deltaproteobacteria bacterium]|nr:OB-fold domain-containing protein [Deltaproteobacteria bacterium]
MPKPSRIKPPMGEDNGWWWEQAAADKLVIQRCTECQVLRHPPRPMCDSCRSIEWDFVEASGRGELASFTVIHHPQIPGYEYPLTIGLIDLEEGTRIVSQLVDCERDSVSIGMALEMTIHEDEDGFKLPVFRPAQAQAKAKGS